MNTILTETTELGEMPVDVYQKLADDRILFITGDINDNIATDICATLLLKDAEDPESKITLFINSASGEIRNAFMIYDMMCLLNSPLETVCLGAAYDGAALLLSAGTPGLRYVTEHSVISSSQLSTDFYTHANMTEAKILMKLCEQDNKRYLTALSKTCNKSFQEVSSALDRRVFFDAKTAVKFGFADKMIKYNKKGTK